MRMLKKLISLISTAAILTSLAAMPSAQAKIKADGYEQQTQILMTLDIIDETAEGEKVTRETFFTSILRMIMDSDKIYSVKGQAAALGLVDSESDFRGGLYISYNDALEAAVKALGYDKQAEDEGGYPSGYRTVAVRLGLTSGVSGERTTPMTVENVNRLLYNMLSVEPMCRDYSNADETLEIMRNETILSINRDIVEISGLITATPDTSLYQSEGNTAQTVTMNSQEYLIGESEAASMLGMHVDAYVLKDSKNEYDTILYVIPNSKKNEEFILTAEQIENVDENCEYIEYLPEGSQRYKKVKLDPTIKLIYNGKFCGSYTYKEFKPFTGEVRLIDNTGDDVYDVAFVTSYETVVVDYISISNLTVYNKYTFEDALTELCLDPAVVDGEINIYVGEEQGSFYSIMENSVLSVQRTKGDRDSVISVYVSDEEISGQYCASDEDDNEICIDDEVYPATSELFADWKASGEDLSFDSYDFRLDAFGRVAYAEKSKSTDFCLFYRTYELDGEDGYAITFMNSNSEWENANMANKVRLNGVNKARKDVYDAISSFDIQVMKIKKNASGEINYIEYAVVGSYDSADYVKTTKRTMNYQRDPQSLGYNALFPATDAKIFIIPYDTSNKEDYYVTSLSYFQQDKNYEVEGYDMDEYNFANAVAVYQAATEKENLLQSTMFIVTGVGKKVEKDDVVSYISGVQGNYRNLERTVTDDVNIADYKKGDIVRIHVNSKNQIDYIKLICKATDIFEPKPPSSIAGPYETGRGTVAAISVSQRRVQIMIDNKYNYRLPSGLPVNVYHLNTNTCEGATIADISVGDTILYRTTWAKLEEVIIIRND